jgi:hypothetical protein
MKLEDAVRQVTDYTSLIALFTDQLGWDIDPMRIPLKAATHSGVSGHP